MKRPTASQMEEAKKQSEQTGLTSSFAFELGWSKALERVELILADILTNYRGYVMVASDLPNTQSRDSIRLEEGQTSVTAEFAFNLGFDQCLSMLKQLNADGFNVAEAKECAPYSVLSVTSAGSGYAVMPTVIFSRGISQSP